MPETKTPATTTPPQGPPQPSTLPPPPFSPLSEPEKGPWVRTEEVSELGVEEGVPEGRMMGYPPKIRPKTTNSADRLAEDKSEAAWDRVEKLVRPAGATATSEVGKDLKIKG